MFIMGKTMPTQTTQENPNVSIDPMKNYSSLVKEANRSALDYQKNLPSYQNQQYGIANEQARAQLAQSLSGADRSANQRGMFYGGKRAGLRAGAESDVAGNLAQTIRGINVGSQDQANIAANSALESAFNLKDQQQAQNIQAYNEAMSRRRNSTGYGIGSALGGIAGMALGAGALSGILGGGSDAVLPQAGYIGNIA